MVSASLWHIYIIWPKKFKPWKIPVIVGSIMVVGVLTSCALLYSAGDLKAAQMNVQHSLICELTLEFEVGHSAAQTTKNIWYVKDEDSWLLLSNEMVQEILL